MNDPRIGVLGIIFSAGLLLIVVIGLSSGEPTGYAIFKSSITKTSSTQIGSGHSFNLSQKQSLNRVSNATGQQTATEHTPEVRATVPPTPKHTRWYAVYYGPTITGYNFNFYITTLNLGSEARICTTFNAGKSSDRNEYASSCRTVGSWEVGTKEISDRRCYEYDSSDSQRSQVPCSGYINVYSEGAHPIIPGGTLCILDADHPSWQPECVSLHFIPKSDIIG